MSVTYALPPPCMIINVVNAFSPITIGSNQYITSTINVTEQAVAEGTVTYTASDIKPGFWISNNEFGQACKIISIGSIDGNNLTLA
jgi:hypothetical protein